MTISEYYILGGAARNLRWMLSTSSSTGMLRSPQRCPLWVGVIFTHTSLLPEARTPSSRLAIRESLWSQIKKLRDTEFMFVCFRVRQRDREKCQEDLSMWIASFLGKSCRSKNLADVTMKNISSSSINLRSSHLVASEWVGWRETLQKFVGLSCSIDVEIQFDMDM